MIRYFSPILLFIFSLTGFSQIDNPVLIKANYEYELQNYEKAIRYYTNLIRSDINKLESLLKRGQCLLYIGLVDDALKDFIKAESIEENSANLFLASSYAYLKNTGEAITWLNKYLQTKNKLAINQVKNYNFFNNIENSEAWRELWKSDWYSKYELMLYHANYLFVNANNLDALTELDNLISKKPRMDEAYLLRSEIYFSLDQFKLALNDCNEAIRFARKNVDYYIQRIKIYKALGKNSKALDDIYYSISIDNNNISLYKEKALILSDLEKYDDAKSEMHNYLNYCYEDEFAMYKMGIISYKTGEFLNALINFNKCLEIDPSNYESFVARGDTYFKTQTYKYAERDYAMALDINPREGSLYYKRALVRKAQKNVDGACSDIQKAIKLGIYDAEVLYYKYCK